MVRPIQLSNLNYFALLMPEVVSRNYPVSLPPLSPELIEKMYGPVQDLSLEIGGYQLSQRSNLELEKIIWDQDVEALDQYLKPDHDRLNPSRYARFLETIAEIVISLRGEGFENQLSTLEDQHLDFVLRYYRDNVYWDRAVQFTTSGILLAERADQSDKDQIWLLANAYSEYLSAGKGNRKKVCREIESRDKFKKAKLVNIREEFMRYDRYFKRMAQLINDSAEETSHPAPFAFTDDQKAELISQCSMYVL